MEYAQMHLHPDESVYAVRPSPLAQFGDLLSLATSPSTSATFDFSIYNNLLRVERSILDFRGA